MMHSHVGDDSAILYYFNVNGSYTIGFYYNIIKTSKRLSSSASVLGNVSSLKNGTIREPRFINVYSIYLPMAMALTSLV